LYKIRGLQDRSAKDTSMDSSLAIVNVVLLLIFFFIATGSLLASKGVEVSLPETAELPLDMLPEPLLVIDGDGGMLLNGEPVATGALADATIAFPTLHVLADRDSNAGQLLEVLASENLIAVEIRLVTIHRRSESAE
jgi:biopolymer transport protein ExbD